MNQFNDVFDVFLAEDKEYEGLKQVNKEGYERFKNIYNWMCSLQQKIYNWLRQAEREINGVREVSTKNNSSKGCSIKSFSS